MKFISVIALVSMSTLENLHIRLKLSFSYAHSRFLNLKKKFNIDSFLRFTDLFNDLLDLNLGSLTLVLRNFSKNLEPWLGLTLNGFPAGLLTAKVKSSNLI